ELQQRCLLAGTTQPAPAVVAEYRGSRNLGREGRRITESAAATSRRLWLPPGFAWRSEPCDQNHTSKTISADQEGDMRDLISSKRSRVPGVAVIATAFGAVAVGAFAIGALAIGRLAVRRIMVESAKLKSLEIQDLTVTKLHAAEVSVSHSLKLPGSEAGARSLHK